MKLTAGSLFSGSGLGDLAVEEAGFEVLWQVEKDRNALKILEREWPNVQRGYDIKTEDPGGFPRPDLLFGGDPCPSRSKASRLGGGSQQEDLWPWILRWVSVLRPLERERLQGAPDNWTRGVSETGRARLMGNAMTRPVVRWIAERIARSIKEVP